MLGCEGVDRLPKTARPNRFNGSTVNSSDSTPVQLITGPKRSLVDSPTNQVDWSDPIFKTLLKT